MQQIYSLYLVETHAGYLSNPDYILHRQGPQGVCTGVLLVVFLLVGAPRRVYRVLAGRFFVGGSPKACVQGSCWSFFRWWEPQGACTARLNFSGLTTANAFHTIHLPVSYLFSPDLSGVNNSCDIKARPVRDVQCFIVKTSFTITHIHRFQCLWIVVWLINHYIWVLGV